MDKARDWWEYKLMFSQKNTLSVSWTKLKTKLLEWIGLPFCPVGWLWSSVHSLGLWIGIEDSLGLWIGIEDSLGLWIGIEDFLGLWSRTRGESWSASLTLSTTMVTLRRLAKPSPPPQLLFAEPGEYFYLHSTSLFANLERLLDDTHLLVGPLLEEHPLYPMAKEWHPYYPGVPLNWNLFFPLGLHLRVL